MPDYLMIIFALLCLLLVLPVFHFLTTESARKLSHRELTWLIIMSVFMLLAIAFTFIAGGPKW